MRMALNMPWNEIPMDPELGAWYGSMVKRDPRKPMWVQIEGEDYEGLVEVNRTFPLGLTVWLREWPAEMFAANAGRNVDYACLVGGAVRCRVIPMRYGSTVPSKPDGSPPNRLELASCGPLEFLS